MLTSFSCPKTPRNWLPTLLVEMSNFQSFSLFRRTANFDARKKPNIPMRRRRPTDRNETGLKAVRQKLRPQIEIVSFRARVFGRRSANFDARKKPKIPKCASRRGGHFFFCTQVRTTKIAAANLDAVILRTFAVTFGKMTKNDQKWPKMSKKLIFT